MDPLFSALTKQPEPARMHAPAHTSKGFLSGVVKGISWISGGALQKKVAQEILPSLTFSKKELASMQKIARNELKHLTDVQQSECRVEGCTLERIAFSASKKPMSERKIIVCFLPNYELWQNKFYQFSEMRAEIGADIVCSNYRGCGKSTGFPKSEIDLVNDGLYQVQQLLDAGAKPENIALYGYSLGGGISMAVAASLEDNAISVNVINERSFRSLSAVVKSSDEFGKDIGAECISALGWNLPSEQYLAKLKGNVVVIHNDYDELIEYEPSLKGALDSKPYPNRAKITCVAMKNLRNESGHNRDWTEEETESIYAAIRNCFKKTITK